MRGEELVGLEMYMREGAGCGDGGEEEGTGLKVRKRSKKRTLPTKRDESGQD